MYAIMKIIRGGCKNRSWNIVGFSIIHVHAHVNNSRNISVYVNDIFEMPYITLQSSFYNFFRRFFRKLNIHNFLHFDLQGTKISLTI